MAKKKKGQGGGSMDEQISSLEAQVKPKGVRLATEIVEGYDPLVIKLAFKKIRILERSAGPQGLGSRIETLLATMPDKDAAAMRTKLLEAKATTATA